MSSTSSHHESSAPPPHMHPLQPLVVLDIEGTSLTDHDRRRIAHPLTGGVILFARNFTSRTQLRDLNVDIKKCNPDVIIFVDHEGGRVQRFKTDGFTHLPAMGKLSSIYDTDPLMALRAAKACGYILASELLVSGVDVSYTPVLDIDYQDAQGASLSQVIGDRAFSSNPDVLTHLAQCFLDGLSLAGMAACGKHFPGHGFACEDSHIAIARDARSKQEIFKQDILPYAVLNQRLAAVMPAHVIYEQVDAQPAGFSKIWLQDILRKELGFRGLVFSDDLSMEGASIAGKDVVTRAKNALNAGCDMVIICNHTDMSDALLDGLQDWVVPNAGTLQQRLNGLMPQNIIYEWDALQQDLDYQQALQTLKVAGLLTE